MKSYGTYFQNDPERPLVYGEVELINPPRQRLRGEPLKEGVLVHPVLVGFCGTDHELMQMGRRGQLNAKFPPGQKRLINGHEGVVWVPSENRFAIVLIRGGDSIDPTRYTEDETRHRRRAATGLEFLAGQGHQQRAQPPNKAYRAVEQAAAAHQNAGGEPDKTHFKQASDKGTAQEQEKPFVPTEAGNLKGPGGRDCGD